MSTSHADVAEQKERLDSKGERMKEKKEKKTKDKEKEKEKPLSSKIKRKKKEEEEAEALRSEDEESFTMRTKRLLDESVDLDLASLVRLHPSFLSFLLLSPSPLFSSPLYICISTHIPPPSSFPLHPNKQVLLGYGSSGLS